MCGFILHKAGEVLFHSTYLDYGSNSMLSDTLNNCYHMRSKLNTVGIKTKKRSKLNTVGKKTKK